jgi:hypothetical protein
MNTIEATNKIRRFEDLVHGRKRGYWRKEFMKLLGKVNFGMIMDLPDRFKSALSTHDSGLTLIT